MCVVKYQGIVWKNKTLGWQWFITGEKPYICSICGVAYKANRSLKFHKKAFHGIIVPDYEIGISTLFHSKLGSQSICGGEVSEAYTQY